MDKKLIIGLTLLFFGILSVYIGFKFAITNINYYLTGTCVGYFLALFGAAIIGIRFKKWITK